MENKKEYGYMVISIKDIKEILETIEKSSKVKFERIKETTTLSFRMEILKDFDNRKGEKQINIVKYIY